MKKEKSFVAPVWLWTGLTYLSDIKPCLLVYDGESSLRVFEAYEGSDNRVIELKTEDKITYAGAYWVVKDPNQNKKLRLFFYPYGSKKPLVISENLKKQLIADDQAENIRSYIEGVTKKVSNTSATIATGYAASYFVPAARLVAGFGGLKIIMDAKNADKVAFSYMSAIKSNIKINQNSKFTMKTIIGSVVITLAIFIIVILSNLLAVVFRDSEAGLMIVLGFAFTSLALLTFVTYKLLPKFMDG